MFVYIKEFEKYAEIRNPEESRGADEVNKTSIFFILHFMLRHFLDKITNARDCLISVVGAKGFLHLCDHN